MATYEQHNKQGPIITLKLDTTPGLTIDQLADGNAQQSDVIDLGEKFAPAYRVRVKIKTDIAPTAGKTVDFYMAESPVNSGFPGQLSGTNSAYATAGFDDKIKQLDPVGSFVSLNTTDQQIDIIGTICPGCRYLVLMARNLLGVALAMPNGTQCSVELIPVIPVTSEVV